MVVKAALDMLLVFVNYSEPSEGGAESPEGITNALLFKDAVEEVSDEQCQSEHEYSTTILVPMCIVWLTAVIIIANF